MQDTQGAVGNEHPIRLGRKMALIILLCAASLVAVGLMHGNELVDHVPTLFAIISGGLGFAGGLFIDVKFGARFKAHGWRGYMAICALPFVAVLLASYLGRLAYEMMGFVGITPTEVRSAAPIIGMTNGKSGPHAIVKLDPTSREIWTSVTYDVYNRLDAHRHPARDCLILAVQTGRFGIRRVILPGRFGFVDSSQLETCPSTVTSWAGNGG